MAEQPKRALGTGFVNFSRILDANRGEAKRMGNQLADQVEGQGAAAQGAVDAGRWKFSQAAWGAMPRYDQGVDLATAEARSKAPDYAGPKTWEDAGINTAELSSQVAKANDLANAGATRGGQAAMIRERAPSATVGGLGLDTFLVNAGAGDRLQAAKTKYGGLSKALQDTRGLSNQVVADVTKETRNTNSLYANRARAIRRENARLEGERVRNLNQRRLDESDAFWARDRARNNQLNETELLEQRDRKDRRYGGRFGGDYEP